MQNADEQSPAILPPVPTGDGSLTCFHPESGELYHNKAGAYTEALLNYVEPSGAADLLKKAGTIRVLDVCYGLGYNTWVLLNELLQDPPDQFAIHITAIERNEETLAFLPHVLQFPRFTLLKSKIPTLEHNTYYRTLACTVNTKQAPFTIVIGEKGSLTLDFRINDARSVLPDLTGGYDLIFHDPFSPQKAPELWSVDLFREYARLLARPHGRVLTYSAAAAVRGGLQEAGFVIGKTAGVGKKSGGTMAGFHPDPGEPLSEDEIAYLQTRAGIPYPDPGLCNPRTWIRDTRLALQQASGRPSGEALRQQGNL